MIFLRYFGGFSMLVSPFFKRAPELSRVEVFDRMRPVVCRVLSTNGQGSGVRLSERQITTATHNVPQEEGQFIPELVQVNIDGVPYPCRIAQDLVIANAAALDLLLLEVDGETVPDFDALPTLPRDQILKEGMEVYFAGYPLGKSDPHFHQGYISSIGYEEGIVRFTIDGTVLPAHSGGPVATQLEGTLYLVGIITSEVADISVENRTMIAMIRALGQETHKKRKIDVTDSMNSLCDVMEQNLSTGLGSVLHIDHISDLFDPDLDLQPVEDDGNFPVGGKGKPKRLIAQTFTDGTKAKKKVAQCIEVRYGRSNKGPRGVRIILYPPLGSGNFTYRFTENPHGAPGNYNNNQEELYTSATDAFLVHWKEDKQAPASFTFDACQYTYTANRET